jgi:hypothetical protein
VPAEEKSLSRLTLRSTSPAKEALLSTSTPFWVAAPPGSERRACGGASIATGAMRIQRKTTMTNRQTSKSAKNAVKVDSDEAKKPARRGERQPRRRSPLVRSRAATALQIDEAAAATALREAIANSPGSAANNDLPAQAAAQSAPESEGADAPTARAFGADRPRASTKRAMLITMLERAQGASVAEIGQRLGWLPHTVRAAITGLRHAGREVIRNKDQNGQSVYRLASVETPDR